MEKKSKEKEKTVKQKESKKVSKKNLKEIVENQIEASPAMKSALKSSKTLTKDVEKALKLEGVEEYSKTEENREKSRAAIIAEVKKFEDEEGRINTRMLRHENPKVYNKIKYHFGSLEELLQNHFSGEIAHDNTVDLGSSLDKKCLRNLLALEYLNTLRKYHTLEEIGERFGTTRANVNQTHRALKRALPEAEHSSYSFVNNKEEEEEETT